MKFEVIGSGGCVSLPKPVCNCKVCSEARIKGRPYSRYGCALFVHGINLLIDTPEDIAHSLNDSSIKEVERVSFSHLDPDHTLGFRVFEQLRLNWFDVSEGKECSNPIDVFTMPHVMEDLDTIRFKYGSYMDYYDKTRNLINRRCIERAVQLEDIGITLVRVGAATIYVFESRDKKLIYAPCDVKPFPEDEIFKDADILLIGNTFIGNELKGGYVLKEDSFLRKDLFSMEEVVSLKESLNIDRLIVTHIEEDWGKSFDDYLELEKQYNNVEFAYDGMIIEL